MGTGGAPLGPGVVGRGRQDLPRLRGPAPSCSNPPTVAVSVCSGPVPEGAVRTAIGRMTTELTINGGPITTTGYLTWAPVPAQLRLTGGSAPGPVTVTLRNRTPTSSGQVIFSNDRTSSGTSSLTVSLAHDGTPSDVFIAGKFQRPSTKDRDATIEVIDATSGVASSVTRLMVRVRKDAMALTAGERARFVRALATLNDRGMGRFSEFPNIHNEAGSPEAHGNAGFLPWHRAFLLDLERELQAIDASVTLPYWRFDRPAPNVFTRSFMGVPDASGTLRFQASNPLQFWATDAIPGIVRRPLFNVKSEPARVISETATLLLGGTTNTFDRFRDLEIDPHGAAHVSFTGFLRSIPTAARDPLFFMLHANVDRLWAKWQWLHRRFDLTSALTFAPLGSFGMPGTTRIGHNLGDTMWPWNQLTGGDRPPTAPGGTLPPSALTNAPGPSPKVSALIDYQGVITPGSWLGFDYDDVPFEA